MTSNPKKLMQAAERCRRLANHVGDDLSMERLLALAEEYEAKAKMRASPNDSRPPAEG